MSNNTILPSMEDFKVQAKKLKLTGNFEKLGHAQNELAKQYGFKDFNSIKVQLREEEPIFSKLPNKIRTYKLSTGAIVNSQGLYKTKEGYSTSAKGNNDYTPKIEIEKSLYFIDNVMQKRKTINIQGSTSYGLKHFTEEYIRHYNLFNNGDGYVSNAAFIIALDIRGYKIKELVDDGGRVSLNIKTNYKSFRGNFYDKLRYGDFDHTIKKKSNTPDVTTIEELKKYNYKDSTIIPTTYFNILENRNTANVFFSHLPIFLFHMIKAMHSINEKGFYFEISKKDLFQKFAYSNEDNQIILEDIENDLLLVNQILDVFPSLFYNNLSDNFIIYWESAKNSTGKQPNTHFNKSYLIYDTFFHKLDKNGDVEHYGEVKEINNDIISIKYDYDDTIYKVTIDELLNDFIFYDNKKLRRRTHILINEASNIENHNFFSKNKNGYLLAKEFIQNNEKLSNFILEKICGYNLNTI